MAFIYPSRGRRRFRRFPPQGIPQVDFRHPLAIGMTSCFVNLPTGIMIDAFTTRPFGTGGTQVLGQHGAASRAVTGPTASPTSDLNWTSGGFSVAVWANVTGSDNAVQIFGREHYVNESSNQGWMLIYRNTAAGSQGWNFQIENNNGINGNPGYGFGDGKPFVTGDQMIGASSDGSVSKLLYRNGALSASSVIGNFVPASNATNGMTFGGSNVTPTVASYVYIACTWKRVLSASNFFEFYSNPYGILIYPEDTVPWTGIQVSAPPATGWGPLLGGQRNRIAGTVN